MKKMAFIAACKDFFGYKPGQTLQEFSAEIKALTPKDREDLIKEFKTVGYEIV